MNQKEAFKTFTCNSESVRDIQVLNLHRNHSAYSIMVAFFSSTGFRQPHWLLHLRMELFRSVCSCLICSLGASEVGAFGICHQGLPVAKNTVGFLCHLLLISTNSTDPQDVDFCHSIWKTCSLGNE